MNKHIGIIAAIVLFSLAGALLYIGLIQPVGNGGASPEVSVNVPAASGGGLAPDSNSVEQPLVLPEGIQLYENAEYGIYFHYRGTYFIDELELAMASGTYYHVALIEDTEENRLLVAGELPGREFPPGITIGTFENREGLSVTEWMQTSQYSNYGLGTGAYALMDAENGKTVVSYAWSGLYEGYTVLYPHNGWIVAASVTYFSAEDEVRRDFAILLQSLEFEE